MIRINLLSQPKAMAASSAGQGWVLVVMLVIAGEIGGLFIHFGKMQENLAYQTQRNQELKAEIDSSKEKVKGHKDVKARLANLRDREDAISKLQDARTGPTAMMLEIAAILTPGRGPTVDAAELRKLRRENPGQVHNPNWDPRGLYLTSFLEGSRKVNLDGYAKSGEDVSEFSKRLSLSKYFEDVRLNGAKRQKVKGEELVSFKISARVLY